ncbi:glutamate synthase [Haliangium sp.]|uniref:glutamate synthase n=1 Tax=Haliangium sp. TaxID=2663208 RepID=UPI003D0BFA84
MAVLRPYPFAALIQRMFEELEQRQSIFDLPARKFFLGDPGLDLAVPFHGRSASTPLGPAAGPHSQMAQNLVLSWLAGCRIMELKTVQILDQLEIPRPCIDMQTIGYNVEWSQELTLEESLEEYVKGAMLIRMLGESGLVQLAPGYERVFYDMSVGYDLAGIQSERVRAFIEGVLDAGEVIERLRAQIPPAYARYRDLDYATRISDTLTLSTFHGCPPDEIEKIISFLISEYGLHCVVKFNPMLLGAEEARHLLHDRLGYDDVRVPDSAFTRDANWSQAQDIVESLAQKAANRGLGFGVKFSNTLIVENKRDFFPATEKEMYLSGPPLHVLAMHLVERFRGRFGDRFPISFAAGIQRKNFPDAVALGLVPITVCTDLLKPGGYGRAGGYFDELGQRMRALGASTVGDFIIRAHGQGEAALDRALAELDLPGDSPARAALRATCARALSEGGDLAAAAAGPATGDAHADNGLYQRWVTQASLLNTPIYVAQIDDDPRYAKVQNQKPPRKIGSHLALFDCITCDKCVPVCPNDANFTFDLPRLEIDIVRVRRQGGAWTTSTHGTLAIAEKHQIGNFADFCNDCGNCDVFCPEDGGPYHIKPRFFGRLDDWRTDGRDGFCLERTDDGDVIHGRIGGRAVSLARRPGRPARYSGDGFAVELDESDPAGTLATPAGQDPAETGAEGEPDVDVEIDLSYVHILVWLRDAVYAADAINYPRVMAGL